MTRYRRFTPPSLSGDAVQPAGFALQMFDRLRGEAKRRRAPAQVDGNAKPS